MTLFCWNRVDLTKINLDFWSTRFQQSQPDSNKVNPIPTKSTQFQQSQPDSNKGHPNASQPNSNKWVNPIPTTESTRFHTAVFSMQVLESEIVIEVDEDGCYSDRIETRLTLIPLQNSNPEEVNLARKQRVERVADIIAARKAARELVKAEGIL